ncbi:c-type cytochrome, partial [Pseudomonas aeruginosa]|uniref:c-type cytochrome n=1 Tax=Pseudomonas aeruginosa TaxID=287 RepID=UPI003D767726
HGPAGSGVGEAFPPLQGQGEMYLSNQLRAWQLGTRRNDPNVTVRPAAAWGRPSRRCRGRARCT